MSDSRWSLAERNMVTVMLTQALLGAVSENIRMVSIFEAGSSLKVQFVFERENKDDREEVEDVMAVFDGLLLSMDRPRFDLESEVVVDQKPLRVPAFPSRAVFKRKESAQ